MDVIEFTRTCILELKLLRREVGQLRSELSAYRKGPNDVVDVDEAAAILGVAPKTLRNRISAGEFPRPDQKLPNGGRKKQGWLVKAVLKHKLRVDNHD